MPRFRPLLGQILSDLVTALGLLTRLPVPRARTHRADAAWGWPLVGLAVGLPAAGLGVLSLALGVPGLVAAAVVIGTGAVLTGGLHEDGLADSADGLFGGWTRERRLEIMKDSQIGTYGTLALLVTAIARAAALAALLQAGAAGAIIAAAAISRAPMAVMMAAMPNARGTGLAHGVGRPSGLAAFGAVVLAVLAALAITKAALAMILCAAIAALAVALLARARIGGQTGDILGAAQQVSELAALACASALIAG